MLKVLMIFHASPCPPELGPARRHFHILREMVSRHDVSVLSFGAPEQRAQFMEQFGKACRDVVFVDNRVPRPLDTVFRLASTLAGRSALRHGFTRKLQRELDLLVEKQRFDLVICSTPFLARYRLPANVPVIADTHNVEWLVMQRSFRETRSLWRKMYYFLQTRSTRSEELTAAARVSAVLATSTHDMDVFRADLPRQRFFVIPNAVDVAAYPACDEAQESCTMLFTGLMSYYANANGVAWLLDEIFPRIKAAVPQARLIVAGARPSRWLRARSSEHIIVTGYVPDIRPFYARAAVFVAPLRIGGGTRVKILEAMAMRRAVVATTLACEGLDVRHEDTVLLADGPQSFADAVIRLFKDKTDRDGFAGRGRALVQTRYDWPAIGARMDTALLSVVRPGKVTAA